MYIKYKHYDFNRRVIHMKKEKMNSRSSNMTSLVITSSLLAVTVISGSVLVSTAVFADNDSVVDDVNIVVPTACTLAGTLNTAHNATINPGQYQADIGTTTLKAFCNDSNGFAIYATGYTGNTIGETNSNKLVGQNTSELIPTGIGTSGDSQWAMKLTTDSGATYPITIGSAPNTSGGADASFSSYHVVPNEYTKVAYRTEGTDVGNNAIGSVLTTTYAVNIASTQSADTYSGKVIYTLVHPNTAPAPVVCNSNGTTIGTNASTDIKCMQDISSTNKSTILSSMTAETQYTLKDKRDGKEYTVAKLADGNIWMTQNLDLDIDSSITYTNEDTDIGYNTTTGQYDTASWTPTRSTYSATNTQTHEWCAGGTWNSQYGYCEDNDTPESYDPGNLYWDLTESDYSDWETYYNSCNYTTSTPTCNESLNPISTYTSSTGTAQYHLGNYYNWAAALATNDSSVYDNGDLAEQSICPAGWTLPRIGTGEDTFYALWNQYGFSDTSFNDTDEDGVHDAGEDALWTSPLYVVPSGSFSGALGGVGGGGGCWSPVADGAGNARLADFDVGGGAGPSNGGYRGYGYSVRCVARPVVSSLSEGGGGGGPLGPNY